MVFVVISKLGVLMLSLKTAATYNEGFDFRAPTSSSQLGCTLGFSHCWPCRHSWELSWVPSNASITAADRS